MVNHCVVIGCTKFLPGLRFFDCYFSSKCDSVPHHPMIAICIFPPVGVVLSAVELVFTIISGFHTTGMYRRSNNQVKISLTLLRKQVLPIILPYTPTKRLVPCATRNSMSFTEGDDDDFEMCY